MAFCEGEEGAIYVIAKFWERETKLGGTVNDYTRRVYFDLKTENLSNKIPKVFGNLDLDSKSTFRLRNHCVQ